MKQLSVVPQYNVLLLQILLSMVLKDVYLGFLFCKKKSDTSIPILLTWKISIYKKEKMHLRARILHFFNIERDDGKLFNLDGMHLS